MTMEIDVSKLEYKPLIAENWSDFETLFGERGACGGCWCMAWRLKASTFNKQKGDENKKAMKTIVASGDVPGILCYYDCSPIGWCSISPREKYIRLAGSKILKSIDDKPVWSISCLFIAKPYRMNGISVGLIKAAVEYAKKDGASIVEGYPTDMQGKVLPGPFIWTGTLSAFINAGFVEVVRRSKKRPVMRFYVK